jgi:OPA family glycerol-3-phosphate transporter-like MFS transporter
MAAPGLRGATVCQPTRARLYLPTHDRRPSESPGKTPSMSETASTLSTTSTYEHPPGYRARRGQNWLFLGLTYASYYLCRYNLGPVAPELMRDLHLTPKDYGWIRTGRDGAYAVGQMVNGLFTDRLGGKRAMTIGAIGTIILNLAFGFTAWSSIGIMLPLLILIRSADGYAQAFGAPGFIKINTAWFRRKERGAFAGIFGAMINLGAAGAPQLAKLISTGLAVPLLFFTLTIPKDWRYVFILPPIIVAMFILLMNLFVRETPEEAGFQIKDDETGPLSADFEERVRLRDVFRKIASNKIVWIVAGAYFCTGFVRSAIEGWWATYLQDIWGLGKQSREYDVFSWGLPVTATFGSLCSGYVSDRFFRGKRAPVAAFLYTSQVFLTLVAFFMPQDTAHGNSLVAVALVIGIAMACNSTHSILGTAAAMDLGGPKMAGCSSGIIDSFQYYGGMLSGYGLGKLFELWYATPVRSAEIAGIAPAGSTSGHIPVNVTIWLGSMLPFGILGASLMTYLWLKHRGADTHGT